MQSKKTIKTLISLVVVAIFITALVAGTVSNKNRLLAAQPLQPSCGATVATACVASGLPYALSISSVPGATDYEFQVFSLDAKGKPLPAYEFARISPTTSYRVVDGDKLKPATAYAWRARGRASPRLGTFSGSSFFKTPMASVVPPGAEKVTADYVFYATTNLGEVWNYVPNASKPGWMKINPQPSVVKTVAPPVVTGVPRGGVFPTVANVGIRVLNSLIIRPLNGLLSFFRDPGALPVFDPVISIGVNVFVPGGGGVNSTNCAVGSTNTANAGNCTICHIPPGNPNNPQTITISPNAWPTHLAHGDTDGPCPTGPIGPAANPEPVQIAQVACDFINWSIGPTTFDTTSVPGSAVVAGSISQGPSSPTGGPYEVKLLVTDANGTWFVPSVSNPFSFSPSLLPVSINTTIPISSLGAISGYSFNVKDLSNPNDSGCSAGSRQPVAPGLGERISSFFFGAKKAGTGIIVPPPTPPFGTGVIGVPVVINPPVVGTLKLKVQLATSSAVNPSASIKNISPWIISTAGDRVNCTPQGGPDCGETTLSAGTVVKLQASQAISGTWLITPNAANIQSDCATTNSTTCTFTMPNNNVWVQADMTPLALPPIGNVMVKKITLNQNGNPVSFPATAGNTFTFKLSGIDQTGVPYINTATVDTSNYPNAPYTDTYSFSSVPYGFSTITEVLPPGWRTTKIECNGSTVPSATGLFMSAVPISSANPNPPLAIVNNVNNTNICIFTNQKMET